MILKQKLTRMWDFIAFSPACVLVNSNPKKLGLFAVLLFAFLAKGELEVMFWEIPEFNQLTVNEGKLKITSLTARTGTIDTLYVNGQKIPFNCGLPAVNKRDCVPFNKIQDFQGKAGRVWWYRGNETGWDNNTRVYQLEVNGNIEIDYQAQKERYLTLKKYYFYPYMILFIISLIMFLLLQFANKAASDTGKIK
ncbi:MAG: hypothetical protein KGZ88_11435 [Methylomicrobium sp.]|nr:hypothetical protein [Methylomicrobium sp.]